MIRFLKRKFEIIAQEAYDRNTSVSFIFLKKIARTTILALTALIDLLFLILLLPFYSFSFLVLRWLRSKKRNYFFFIGLDHVIYKTVERALQYEARGYACLFFSYEFSGERYESDQYTPVVKKYSPFIFWDTVLLFFYLYRYRPSGVEVYNEGGNKRQFIATLFMKALGVKIICIERGTLVNFLTNTMSYIDEFFLFKTYTYSDYVFYREPYMEKYLRGRVEENKLFYDYNKVKIKHDPIKTEKYSSRTVLFLNGFAALRRIDLLVKAVPLVKKEIKNVNFMIVGARSAQEKERVQKMIREENVEDSVQVFDWTSNAASFYDKASLFVLPADIVFCNFSLLEAMERGVPALVADVRSSDLIVKDGFNGYRTAQTAPAIAEAIIKLLEDESNLARMGANARELVMKEFNSDTRLEPVFSLLKGEKI